MTAPQINDIAPVGDRQFQSHGRPSSQPQVAQEAHFAFSDLIDIINPLHHLPLLGPLYRHLSGDEITGHARVLGGLLFGGPMGLLSGAFNAIMAEEAGGDPGERLLARVLTEEGKEVVQITWNGDRVAHDDTPPSPGSHEKPAISRPLEGGVRIAWNSERIEPERPPAVREAPAVQRSDDLAHAAGADRIPEDGQPDDGDDTILTGQDALRAFAEDLGRQGHQGTPQVSQGRPGGSPARAPSHQGSWHRQPESVPGSPPPEAFKPLSTGDLTARTSLLAEVRSSAAATSRREAPKDRPDAEIENRDPTAFGVAGNVQSTGNRPAARSSFRSDAVTERVMSALLKYQMVEDDRQSTTAPPQSQFLPRRHPSASTAY